VRRSQPQRDADDQGEDGGHGQQQEVPPAQHDQAELAGEKSQIGPNGVTSRPGYPHVNR
jgi:hypothetical protein